MDKGTIAHTTQDGMLFLRRDQLDACALLVILTVVSHPRIAQHLMTETIFITGSFCIKTVFCKSMLLVHLERVR